jgi:hypothetical protein
MQRKKLNIALFLPLFLLFIVTSTSSFGNSPLKNIDWRNFTYPYPDYNPDGKNDDIHLVGGIYRWPGEECPKCQVYIQSIDYADLDNDGELEAAIVLGDLQSGSDGFHAYLYIYKATENKLECRYYKDYERARKIFIKKNKVIVVAPLWLDEDPHCCNTYEATYVIKMVGLNFRVYGMSLKKLHKEPVH